MPRIPRSRPAPMADDLFRQAQKYLFDRTDKLLAEAKFKRSSKPIKEWLDERDDNGKFVNGVEDTEGNRVFKFSRLMQGVDGKTYSGVMLKRSQGENYFDPEEVLEFIRVVDVAKGANGHISERVIKTIEVPDLDELYVLQQEGTITEKQLRGLMHEPAPQYALWPIEAKAVLEE